METKPLQIPYGVSDFKTVRNEGLYYIDKTGYIPILEQAGRFLFFVRPRRFGKSLFLDMLRCYYDLAEKDNFDALFGGLEIGKNPTENRNRYQVLALDFSKVNKGEGDTLAARFENYVGDRLDEFMLGTGSLTRTISAPRSRPRSRRASSRNWCPAPRPRATACT